MKRFLRDSSLIVLVIFFFITTTTLIPDAEDAVVDWIDRFNVGMLSSFILFGASVLAIEEIKNRWTNRRRHKTKSA